LTVLGLNKLAETDSTIDDFVDNKLIELSDVSEDYVIDSRMGWHFVKDSFKVYLIVESFVSAKRIMQDKRGNVESYLNVEDARMDIMSRTQEELKRYKEKYGVDLKRLNNYDLVIDTTLLTREDVIDTILCNLRERGLLNGDSWRKV
jgi:cytidylate kinase